MASKAKKFTPSVAPVASDEDAGNTSTKSGSESEAVAEQHYEKLEDKAEGFGASLDQTEMDLWMENFSNRMYLHIVVWTCTGRAGYSSVRV